MANKDDKAAQRDQPGSGQVRHDDRGNAVWHWAADTARTAMQSASQVLRKLDLSNLSIETDQKKQLQDEEILPGTPSAPTHPAQLGTGKRPPVDTRARGFDPYSSTAGTARRTAPVAAKPAAAKLAAAKPATAAASHRPAATEPRRSWLQRLLRRD